jgi:vancomycin resistance protein VanW
MKNLLTKWKRPLRNLWKYSQALRRGYPFYYTHQQNPEFADRYPYLWSEFTTPIPSHGTVELRQNRIWNLQLAARRVNYLQLHPQQIFSFCDRVGEPTVSRGFRAGFVFVCGEVRTDIGGGLCLMATNLFNTFLRSSCQILERHCHSIDAYGESRFYELGQDAAIAYGYKDLIIQNRSQIPLQLRFQVQPETGKVISSLWGESPSPWQIKVESITRQEIPSPLENGISGWIVETTRYFRDLSTPTYGTIESCENLNVPWQLDYRSTSVYQPCIRSVSTHFSPL